MKRKVKRRDHVLLMEFGTNKNRGELKAPLDTMLSLKAIKNCSY
jgi:hypothetical protein